MLYPGNLPGVSTEALNQAVGTPTYALWGSGSLFPVHWGPRKPQKCFFLLREPAPTLRASTSPARGQWAEDLQKGVAGENCGAPDPDLLPPAQLTSAAASLSWVGEARLA
ncbi:unnamed protein product [Rangifer tarandus platyrhynchus]|uniref:Uncharacterized protein n=1 Tax=Rangifer tarandus platyrhynchus TaxID=3082113 RepID=A0AC59Y5A4_RANTA